MSLKTHQDLPLVFLMIYPSMPPPKRSTKASMLNGGATTTNHKHVVLAKHHINCDQGEVLVSQGSVALFSSGS
jgi:hypothetical protein